MQASFTNQAVLQPLALLLWHHPQTKLYQNHATQVQVYHLLIETLAVTWPGAMKTWVSFTQFYPGYYIMYIRSTYKAKTTLTHQIIVFIKKLKAHGIEVNDEWEWQMASRTDHLLDEFAKLQKATVSFIMYVHLSIHPHRTTRLPLDRFSWNLISEYFFKPCQ
jgi:hypothetical protein